MHWLAPWPTAVGLSVVLLAAVAIGAPRALAVVYTQFDFESPSYGSSGRLLSDHYLLKNAGVWHLFYTEFSGVSATTCRIGHATSTDLIHWTERSTVMTAGSPSWMSTGTWAPHVIAAPGGGWRMFFTGRNDFGSQGIGLASSSDLETWTLTSANPVWTAPTSWALWGSSFACSCRDPFVWFDAGSGQYRMLFTAVTLNSEAAVGWAGSSDLVNWTDLGPLVVDPHLPLVAELESPCLLFDNGRVELCMTQLGTILLTAPAITGPWNLQAAQAIDPLGRAPELVKDGTTHLLSRVRGIPCGDPTGIVLVDSVTATPSGYSVPGPPALPISWLVQGDAFTDDPTFGDSPALRGETPVQPGGLRWLASAEDERIPQCPSPAQYAHLGSALSPQFLLRGDAVSLRLSGAASPESSYVALVDDCTGLELVKQTGPGGNGMVPVTWSNSGRRGWPVRVRVVDALDRPDGGIGVDDVRDTSVVDQALPSLPSVTVTRPLPGENLTGGSNFTIRWNATASAGLDSFLVYVSYDHFATPPTKLTKRNANQFSYSWPVPPGTQFDARVRIVAYAKNAVHGCNVSGPFTISVTVDAGGVTDAAGIRLSAFGNPGARPLLAWSTPPTARARLIVFDASGRRVRALYDGDGGGERRTAWDGRDDAGRAVGPGIYFALLSCPDGHRALPLVRLSR